MYSLIELKTDTYAGNAMITQGFITTTDFITILLDINPIYTRKLF